MDSFQSLLLFSVAVTASQSLTLCPYTPKTRDPTLYHFNLSDGYEVTWMHAANSVSKLNQALAGNLMMIEADVQMRHNRSDTDPIMAHPPDTDSNLTFIEFLEKVTASNKGIKLDFKSIIAVEPSLKILKNISDSKGITNPVWLNADILDGPCFDKCSLPVDPKMFLELCKQYFPSAVLSLGWTTGHDVKDAKNKYTWSHVVEMGKLINHISEPVTFAVRAVLIERSSAQLHWLVDLSRNLTLTVWSSEIDEYDQKALLKLLTKIYNKKNVYYDLPENQAEEFRKTLRGMDINPSNPYQNQIKVKAYTTAMCTDVLVGETKVMFAGKGGWVSSADELNARNLESMNIGMDVSFLSLNGQDVTQNLTVIVGSGGLSGTNAVLQEDDGVRLVLQSTGEFQIIAPDAKITKSSGAVHDPNSQYTISILYGASMNSVTFTVYSKADYHQSKYLTYKGESNLSKKFMIFGAHDLQGSPVLVEEISSAIALPSSRASRMHIPITFLFVLFLIPILLGMFLYNW